MYNPNYPQAPKLLSVGEKKRTSKKWGSGFAMRSTALEVAIFNGIDGKCGAQLKLILFLTGNADDGSFAIAEKTVCERCGMTPETYKKARKALEDKGWITHKNGAITVLYDNIYGEGDTEITSSHEGDNENTPSTDNENSPSRDNEDTYNIINNTTKRKYKEEKVRSVGCTGTGYTNQSPRFIF